MYIQTRDKVAKCTSNKVCKAEGHNFTDEARCAVQHAIEYRMLYCGHLEILRNVLRFVLRVYISLLEIWSIISFESMAKNEWKWNVRV